jgi:hypothetical protein
VSKGPPSDGVSERGFWEAGGLYRDSTHPVVELFARQRIGFLVSRGIRRCTTHPA